jgi:predicted dehydrogenase
VEPVRLGYVGCGFMAQRVHIPNFASLPNCRLVALAEVRADLREAVGERYRIPRRYASHLEMAADQELDAVAVSAGYALQGEMAVEFLRRGLPVFMEKPMATTVAAGEALLDAARLGGGRLMIGYMKRYDAGNELAREAVRQFRETGELGGIVYLRSHGFCGDWICGLDTPFERSPEPAPPSPPVVPEWLPARWVQSYLGYLQQYTHNVNLMRWLLDAGDEARVRHVDLDDDGHTGVAVLEVGGVRALLESGSITHYRWDEHTQVYFQHGWVKASAPPLLLRNQPAEVEVYRARPGHAFSRPIPEPAWSWAYKREVEAFVQCVQTGEPFDSSAEDTLTDVRLFEELYRNWLRARGEI